MNLLTLRFGEHEIPELGARESATNLTGCGLEIGRSPGRSLTASPRSYIGRLFPLVILGCLLAQHDKETEPSRLRDISSSRGQLSCVATGSRLGISAQRGKLSERVNNLRHMASFTTNQLAAYVKDTKDLLAIQFPANIDVTRLQLGIAVDGSMGRLKNGKCVDPRACWLRIPGDGITGVPYHLLGSGSNKSRKIARSPIVCEGLAMYQALRGRTGIILHAGTGMGARDLGHCGQ